MTSHVKGVLIKVELTIWYIMYLNLVLHECVLCTYVARLLWFIDGSELDILKLFNLIFALRCKSTVRDHIFCWWKFFRNGFQLLLGLVSGSVEIKFQIMDQEIYLQTLKNSWQTRTDIHILCTPTHRDISFLTSLQFPSEYHVCCPLQVCKNKIVNKIVFCVESPSTPLHTPITISMV